MTRLKSVVSRRSWWFFYLCFAPIFFLLFRPTPLQFLLFLAVDILVGFLCKPPLRALFFRLFPPPYQPVLDFQDEDVRRLSVSEKVKLCDYLMRYPLRRALFVFPSSFVKAIPVGLFVVFSLGAPGTHLELALKVAFAAMAAWIYFYAMVFIESHAFISRKLRELHEKQDWSEVFRRVTVPGTRSEFQYHETLVLGLIWFLMIAMQFMAVTSWDGISHTSLLVSLSGISIACLALLTRIWYHSRHYFISGLDTLYSVIQRFDPGKPTTSLPLHSSAILAQFETSFNTLLHRLAQYEHELKEWTFARVDESRFQTLGEISALVIHDLSSPIHAARYCVEQMRENPAEIYPYIERLESSLVRAEGLIFSLRCYLKNERRDTLQMKYQQLHHEVLTLLSTQFHTRGFERIRFEVDQRLEELRFAMASPDVLHVFHNLFSNSIRNLLDNSVGQPVIRTFLKEKTTQHVVIGIEDNGTGLTLEQFENLTVPQKTGTKEGEWGSSLGLRLVRRLVEQQGGRLSVEPDSGPGHGTRFRLELAYAMG